MDVWKQRAYAKINLSLDVVRRRDDGYHEVKMIMQTVDLYDEITMEKREDGIRVTVDMGEGFLGETIPSDENNLVYKAAKFLMDRYGIREGIQIHLDKHIPVAAGMAGGSTDAAAVFRGMNELFGLGMDTDEMERLAVKIGADVPFCIAGGTQLSEGIGEILTRLTPTPDFWLLIAKPDISVSTKYVYEKLGLDTLESHPDVEGMAKAVRDGDKEGIVSRMGNVLESVTLKEYPVIGQIKSFMKENGAENALMSGSGPTVFGVYKDMENAEAAAELLETGKLAKQIFVAAAIGNIKEGR